MSLEIADYVVLSTAVITAVFGLFIGFSGTLAFLSGALSAVACGFFAWEPSAELIANSWLRALAVGIASLLVFGLVRFVVKRGVHGLVAQPGDAIFGAITSALSGAIVSLGVVGLCFLSFGWQAARSELLETVLDWVGR